MECVVNRWGTVSGSVSCMIWGSRVEFASLMISRVLQLHGWLCSSMPVCSASSLLHMRVVCVCTFWALYPTRVCLLSLCILRVTNEILPPRSIRVSQRHRWCVTSGGLVVPCVIRSFIYCPFFAYIIHPPIYKGACWLISLQVFFPPFPFSSSSLGTSDFRAWDIPLSSSTDLIWACDDFFLHLEDPSF